jgi:pimeloyl-ACP methyl ester carboxylesterase
VSGRALVGQCVGPGTDAATVVLEVGMGAPRDSLLVVEDHLGKRAQVCSYDRAGKGDSGPASRPRPVSEVVSDLHAFLAAVNKPPYFLVGHSFGADVVFLYAQAHPGPGRRVRRHQPRPAVPDLAQAGPDDRERG